MKQIFSFLTILCLAALPIFAQSPQSFKYQAVVRNTDGNPYASKSIAMRISIVAGSISGEAVYVETHQTTTTDLGLVNLEIGKGTPKTGTFAVINWGMGTYFVKVEFDPDGGSNYTLLGTSQLLSVPFALYAEKAGNGFSGNYADLTNTPDLSRFLTADQITPFSGSYNDLTDKPDLTKFLTADDVTQGGVPKLRVSQTGDTLSLGKDNYVIVTGISESTYARGITYPEVLEVKVTEVNRNSDGDVEVTLSYKVKCLFEPELREIVSLYNTSMLLGVGNGDETVIDCFETSKGIWQGTVIYTFDYSRYASAGVYQLTGMGFYPVAVGDDIFISIPPITVNVPSGGETAPTPVITRVSFSHHNLGVESDGLDIKYVTFLQKEPNKSERPKRIWGSGGYLGDIPLGTTIRDVKVVDVLGQVSPVWSETLTYTGSSECEIFYFYAEGGSWTISGTSITRVFPMGTVPSVLTPEIKLSDFATISPEVETPQNFFTASGVTYTVTAENGDTKTYTVKAIIATE